MARELGSQMLLAEWLFVETLDDLSARCAVPESQSRYQLLGIAPLLRKLLLDGSSLLEAVRSVRPEVGVNFYIRPWCAPATTDPNLNYSLRLGGPELVSDATSSSPLDVAGFVAARVGQIDGLDISVRQVVRYFAHVEGGAHLGVPKESGEQTWSHMAPLLLGNCTGQIQILANLGQITVAALEPLRDSILSSPTIIPAMHRRNPDGHYDLHWTADRFRAPTTS